MIYFFSEKINEPINVHIALGYMGEKNNIRKNIFNTYKKMQFPYYSQSKLYDCITDKYRIWFNYYE